MATVRFERTHFLPQNLADTVGRVAIEEYRGFDYDVVVRIREYIDTDWPSVWPIFREVVAAGNTFAYDPKWTSEQARDVWVVDPPGRTVVACAAHG
jgi:hypothetical protein